MFLREMLEATQVYNRTGGKVVRKYRCTSGARKGRTMSSPASCNKPLRIQKSKTPKTPKMPKASRPSQISMSGVNIKRNNLAHKRIAKAIRPRKTRGLGRGSRI